MQVNQVHYYLFYSSVRRQAKLLDVSTYGVLKHFFIQYLQVFQLLSDPNDAEYKSYYCLL